MRNIILIGAFVISIFVASCSKENIADNSSVIGEEITISADVNKEAQTRMVYNEDAKEFKMSWSLKEQFIVYNGYSSEGEVFSKVEEGNKFGGKVPTGQSNYYAVYGGNEDDAKYIVNESGLLTIDIANQVGTNAENGIRTFMLAESENLTSTTNLKFEHKLAILKLNLTLPADFTATKVDEVIVSNMCNKADYELNFYKTYSFDYDKGDIIANNGTNGFAVTEKAITVYVAVFPETVVANSVTIIAVVGKDKYAYTIKTAKTIIAGKVIPVEATLEKKDIYIKSDYCQWDAFESYNKPDNKKWEKGSSYYHPGAGVEATQLCMSCPTEKEMKMYLGAGVYWDKKGGPAFTLPGGKTYTQGLWVKKKEFISGFEAGTAVTVDYVYEGELKKGTPTNKNEYFSCLLVVDIFLVFSADPMILVIVLVAIG
jgi:hypothetical protein